MWTRRRVLKVGVATGAGLLASCGGPVRVEEENESKEHPGSPVLTKFLDALPILAVVQPTARTNGMTQYEMTMTQFQQQLHRQLPPTTLWGYNGQFPGPTIEARRDEAVRVRWRNDLPLQHLLAVDPTIHGAEPPHPAVRTVVHLHGGHTPPDSDGYPDAWYVPGQFADYDYPNTQQATTLWYHDHTFGITRLNIVAGLAGIYLVRDAVEDQLNLPSGPYEIPLIIQDRSFKPNGSLSYPDKGITHPIWVPEFFGDTAVVNGKVWPFLDVEPRQYRLRIVNGSNARFYRLALSGGLPFHQIGSDGGFLPAPITLSQILLAPAERADVVIDFTGLVGQQITLSNDAPAPFPEGEESVAAIPEIMQFRVVLPLSATAASPLPAALNPVPRIPESDAVRVRDLTLEEEVDGHDEPVILRLNGALFEDPITEQPEWGTSEIWRLINLTGDTHPIHPHQVQFQILDRTPFDADRYLEDKAHRQVGPLESYFVGDPLPPEPQEAGWKDVVRANPREVTRFIAHFDIAGKYVWHCHILEHEDNDMMRPYEVVVKTG